VRLPYRASLPRTVRPSRLAYAWMIRLEEHPELARAYDRAGFPDSAIAVYERFLAAPAIDRVEVDAFELPDALFRLAELYEQRGGRARIAVLMCPPHSLAPQSCSRLVSWMSAEPARVEPKLGVVPSQESDGLVSSALRLTSGPRFIGVDHGLVWPRPRSRSRTPIRTSLRPPKC